MPLSLPNVMSTFPVRVDAETTVAGAVALLEEHGFHHLPVSEGDAVLGVVSASMLLAARVAGGAGLALRELCKTPPVTVDIHTPLTEVAHRMREVGADAAVVMGRGRLAGILTTSDLCTVLIGLVPGPPPVAPRPDVA
jgi:acetoin utilization protein AcuB